MTDRVRISEYSACTFVTYKIPVSLFGPDHTGILIRRKQQRIIPYWYNGCNGEELTVGMSFRNNRKIGIEIQNDTNKLHHKKEEVILRYLINLFYKKYERTKQNFRNDKYGILINKWLKEAWLPWNEGLFRYKKEDIFGININDKKQRKDVVKALRLREKLVFELKIKKVPLFYYYLGSLERFPSQELIQKFKILPKEYIYSKQHAGRRR